MIRIPLNQSGISTLLALLLLVAMSILVSTIFMFVTTDVFISRNDANAKEAFFAAEAGIHHAEMLLGSGNFLDNIESLYRSGYDVDCFMFNNRRIGHKLSDLDGAWIARALDARRSYQVFIENDEKDPATGLPALTENNNQFLIRAVGMAGAHTRKIIEVSFNLQYRKGLGYVSQVGGGSTNLTPQ